MMHITHTSLTRYFSTMARQAQMTLNILQDFNYNKVQDIFRGKFYTEDQKYIHIKHQHCFAQDFNMYNPFHQLETSRVLKDIQYDKLNLFQYFAQFENLITNNTQYELNYVSRFIQSLCAMQMGNIIHQRISNEISQRTNALILKGDYLMALGYCTITKLGSSALGVIYSQIAKLFSQSMFSMNMVIKKDLDKFDFHREYIVHTVNKYVGFIYLGCLGLMLLHGNSIDTWHESLLVKYAFLVYLREELAFSRNVSYEYYTSNDDLQLSLRFFSPKKNIDEFHRHYQLLSLHIYKELLEIIDTFVKPKKLTGLNMENLIGIIYANIHTLCK